MIPALKKLLYKNKPHQFIKNVLIKFLESYVYKKIECFCVKVMQISQYLVQNLKSLYEIRHSDC